VRGRTLSVVRGVAALNFRSILKGPAKMLPPLLVPLFFFVAFKGALSGVGDSKNFGYYDFTAFEFVLILFMAAMFVGAFTSFDIVDAYEGGLGRRLMAGAPRRMAIIFGFLIVNVGRCLLGMALVWGVILATGMEVRGGPLDIAALVAIALLLNLATFLYGAGLALRIQSAGAGTLVLIPLIIVMFLTPIFTPRDQLTGLVEKAASWNPLTAALEAGRGFMADDPVSVALAFGVCAGLVALSSVWVVLGMRKAEQKG
jgi:ABC-2 type transport system permease protein